jgi:hypothetical protein
MDYFGAVQEGRRRVSRAVDLLRKVAGPSYPMLFLKIGASEWTPVGDEMLQQAVPGKDRTSALVICDAEGNAKAMSAWLPEEKAAEQSKLLESQGVKVFPGQVKLPI